MKKSLIERLNQGPVICAEGFLFELEKRGYMSAGEFAPMVALENPNKIITTKIEVKRNIENSSVDIGKSPMLQICR